MSNPTSVRFIHNFIMTVVQTNIDEGGALVVSEKKVHVAVGDVYSISQYQELPDGKVTLEFPDTSPIAGIAERIEKDVCTINTPVSRTSPPPRSSGGCGGCGHKNK